MPGDKLEELEKRLYRPEEGFGERSEEFTEMLGTDEGAGRVPSPPKPVSKPAPEPPRRRFWTMRTILLTSVALIFLAGVGAGVYAVFFRGPQFFRRDVIVTLAVPEGVSGGEEAELRVSVENRTPFALQDAELALEFPEGTIVAGERRVRETRPVGTVAAQGQWQDAIPLRLLGARDAVKKFSARLTYRPGIISSRFENDAETATTILSVPFILSLDLPKEAFPNSSVQYVLTYQNTGGAPLADAALVLSYPQDFSFGEALPVPVEGDSQWDLGVVKSQKKGTITIAGAFEPGAWLDQEVRAALGVHIDGQFVPYVEVVGVTRVVKPFLELTPVVQGQAEYAARLGERLGYQATWRNVGSVALQDVKVRARPVGALFELSTLNPGKGVFDSRTGEIAWTSREVPELAIVTPNEIGALTFDIQLKPSASIQKPEDREFSVAVDWTIETTSVPKELHVTRIVSEAKTVTPISSKVELAALGYFTEPSRVLTNTGPFPPKVNETTTYTIHWVLKTFANPVERAEVSAFLAPGVEFLGEGARLLGEAPLAQFNARTGEIVWSVSKVEPAAGILQPALEVVFQVGLTPSTLQKGTTPLLVSESRLTAVDAFTKVRLDTSAPRITTATIEGGGTVQ